jgi:hypothetical protein
MNPISASGPEKFDARVSVIRGGQLDGYPVKVFFRKMMRGRPNQMNTGPAE